MTSPFPSQSGPSDLANTAVLLHQAVDAIERVVPRRLAASGHGAVRTAHGVVFQHLDPGGTTVSALAERAGMTKQAMAELVAYLEHHGYVSRVPAPQDRRAKLVQLTQAGRQVVTVALGLVPELETRIISALGEKRWRELRKDLQTIRTLFDQDDQPIFDQDEQPR